MAIAHISSLVALSANSSTITSSGIDTTGATLLFGAVGCFGGTIGAGAFTDSKGNTWGALTTYTDGSIFAMRAWYAWNPTVGTGHTFSYNDGKTDYPGMAVGAYSGVDISGDPLETSTGAGQASATTQQPGSITPGADNQILITVTLIANAGVTATINGGFTIRVQAPNNGSTAEGMALADLIQTTATAANPTWTPGGSATGTIASMATFRAAAGGVSGNPYYAYRQQ